MQNMCTCADLEFATVHFMHAYMHACHPWQHNIYNYLPGYRSGSQLSKEQCVYIALCFLSFQFIVALELGLM